MSKPAAALVASRIRVVGVVQGVGMRPWVWRLAHQLGLRGWVRNDAAGVEIHAEGEAAALQQLLQLLGGEAPPLARVDAVTAQAAPLAPCHDFVISDSGAGAPGAAIGPDAAICDACLEELFEPASRRWRHAFITCTHCGPRYTLTARLPYDRAQTSMAPFALCANCREEYENPADRRFHAETTCCLRCGPQLRLVDGAGAPIAGDAVAATLALLQDGAIVAIKGLGGFHLACDARNAAAVAALRQRKGRDEKPFAVMLASVVAARTLASIPAAGAALLTSSQRPIVLLRKRAAVDDKLAGVAPGLDEVGLMLPATPLQYLLFHEAAGRPQGTAWLDKAPRQPLALVMTSANISGEPLLIDDDEAQQRLAGVADAFLMHDRAIVVRCDDSVRRGDFFIRRARGHAPTAIALARSGPSVLAFGGWFKNTICVTRGAEAFLSQHIGDLDNAAACGFLEECVQHLLHILAITPQAAAHDLHPDFFSSRYAVDWAQRHGLPCIGVQHHHAHIAAVCAEHGEQGPVLGLALDGVGLGADGGAWGGELLLVQADTCQRLGHLTPLPLPGGDVAARQPWRMAAAALHRLGRGASISERFAAEAAAPTVAVMLERGVNCPPTSSAGRCFDAAAGLLQVRRHAAYEGQAAMLLEALAARGGAARPLRHGWRLQDDGCLDLSPLLAWLADAPPQQRAAAAACFHVTLATALADWAAAAAAQTGVRVVAAGGGCLLNRLLARHLRTALRRRRLRLLLAQQAPANDGGLALGQAWVAQSRLCK